MRVMRLGAYNLAISSAADLLDSKYKPEPIDLSKYQRIGKQLVSKAAAQGNPHSQYQLAFCLLKGRGTDTDLKQGFRWMYNAAEQGYLEAQYLLGCLLYEGTCSPINLKAAAEWFHKAADRAHGPAQSNLGAFYIEGHGVEKDMQEAFFWLTLAAEHRVLSAMAMLKMHEDKIPSEAKEKIQKRVELWKKEHWFDIMKNKELNENHPARNLFYITAKRRA